MNNQKELGLLNDLVRINNDRIEGYQKASENLKGDNNNLRDLFGSLQTESEQNNQQLTGEIKHLGGSPDTGTTTGGKVYRTWMDVKATFGGNDPKSILESCERGEDAAKKAYQTVLESGDLSDNITAVIANQQERQLQAHDRIKALRDQWQHND